MDLFIKIILGFILILSLGCSGESDPGAASITILTTDLSIDKDPDDWFDTYLFLTLDSINPVGIILDNYATDNVENKLKEFMSLLEVEDVVIRKGIQNPLKVNVDQIEANQHHEGSAFILETMENRKEKVRIIAVGTLRNEAWAYLQNPALFKEKIEMIYFAGGTLDGSRDVNVKRGIKAADILINANIPICWIPVTSEMKQKLSGEQEKQITDHNSELCLFFTKALADWRLDRGEEWLERTQQLEGKNLWSTPAFTHLAMTGDFNVKFVRGTMTFDTLNWTGFRKDSKGMDLMLTQLDQAGMTTWLTNKIIATP